jgi:hypothetical protein
MRKNKSLPSQEYLQECFEYNADTGELFWKTRPRHHFKNSHAMNTFNGKYAGNIISTISHGYYVVGINAISYQVHRIIWKLVTGNDPKEFIDHKDNNRMNNAIENLREASTLENPRNAIVSKNNKLGVKGVHFRKDCNKYRAIIDYNHKVYHLGYFNTIEEASLAYQEASLKYHGEFGKF